MKKIMMVIVLEFFVYNIQGQEGDINIGFEKLDIDGSIIGWQGTFPKIVPIKDTIDGSNAVSINTWYVNSSGYLILGKYNSREPRGVPFTKRPKNLKGFYKYIYGDNCNGKDSAQAFIFLKRYNYSINKPDTIGVGKVNLGPKNDFIPFEVSITYYTNQLPDTICIEFHSTYFDRTVQCKIPENRFLTIKNLNLEYLTPTEDVLKSPITIYPNPTTNTIRIDWGENIISDIILKDTMGRILQKKNINTEGVSLDLSDMASGIYFIEFKQKEKHITTRKIIKQ